MADSSMVLSNFQEAEKILKNFISNSQNIKAIESAGELIYQAFKTGNKVISCGNGGSMCDAMHFAEELSGRYRENRPALAAIAISDPSHLSCVGNDYGYSEVFSRFIEGMGSGGDILLAITTSGNSENVLKAAETAKSRNMRVIGLTGKDGGKMAGLSDIEIRAPYSEYADRAQEIHIKVIHSLIHYVENKLFS